PRTLSSLSSAAATALVGATRTRIPSAALPLRSAALPAFTRSFHASPFSLGTLIFLRSRPLPLSGSASLAPLWATSSISTAHSRRSSAHADEIVKVPSMAESITEGTLKQWLKQKGDYVEADEEVATIETDKIDVAVNAPKAGTLTELLANEEDTVAVGQDLFKLEPGEAPAGGAKKEEPKEEKKDEPKEEKKEEPKKESADAAPKSEYRKPDSAQKAPKAPEPAKKEAGASAPKPQAGARTETRVKMSRMRARIAERLKEAQNTAASLTTFNEIDMSSLMSFRSKYKDQVLKDHNVKLGFMSAFAKASCIALKEIPAANASIEGEGNSAEIVYRDYVDLSVAVATPKGLVTPVLRNAEGLNFVQIEEEIANLGKKARDNKLTLEDMSGGSFTISNGGVFGSLYGTPIINTPQAAVLGMHSIKDKAVVVDGKIVIRPIMVVALTCVCLSLPLDDEADESPRVGREHRVRRYDHRLLDGREAVTFLVRIKQLIEDPRLFALYN
ncbi:SPOSA6832_01973, partial [Sporobolomyces salmonicolor]